MVESLHPADEVRPDWSIRSRIRRLSLSALVVLVAAACARVEPTAPSQGKLL